MGDRKPGQLLFLSLEFVSSEKEILMCHNSCHAAWVPREGLQ